MKRRTFRALLALVAVGTTACGDSSSILGTKPILEPSLEVQLECNLNPTACARIQAGINALRTHPSGSCNAIGNGLQGIFDAVGMGFRFGDGESDDMWVYMQNDPNANAGGQSRADDWINVNRSENGLEDPGLLAHEWEHYTGWDNQWHTTGHSTLSQAACGGS